MTKDWFDRLHKRAVKRRKERKKVVLRVISQTILILALLLVILMALVFMTGMSVYANTIEVSNDIREIALQIHEKCELEDTPFCVEYNIQEFVNTNIGYESDSILQQTLGMDNNVDYTLRNGGDCENQAILALSLLKALNVSKIYFVLQVGDAVISGRHACWMVQKDFDYRFYNCFSDMIISEIKLIS